MSAIGSLAKNVGKGLWYAKDPVVSTAKFAWKGGTAGRMALGGAAGGMYGAVAGDYETGTMRLNSMAHGALLGASAGALAGILPRQGAQFAKDFWSKLPAAWAARQRVASGAMNLADKSLRAGGSIAGFAINHPYATGGILAGAGGAAAMGMSEFNRPFMSPTLSGAPVNSDYDQQAIAVANMQSGVLPSGQMGTLPQMAPSMMSPAKQDFQQSTDGLVQGLHQGRHR